MKNLENYGVLELDTREMNQVDGGHPIILAAAAAGFSYLIASYSVGFGVGYAAYELTH